MSVSQKIESKSTSTKKRLKNRKKNTPKNSPDRLLIPLCFRGKMAVRFPGKRVEICFRFLRIHVRWRCLTKSWEMWCLRKVEILFVWGGQSFLFKQTWRETRFYQAKKYHFLFFSGFLLSITLSFQITKCFLGKPWAPSLPPNAPRPRAFDVARVFDPKALPPEQNFQNPENIAANPDWFVGILRYRYL